MVHGGILHGYLAEAPPPGLALVEVTSRRKRRDRSRGFEAMCTQNVGLATSWHESASRIRAYVLGLEPEKFRRTLQISRERGSGWSFAPSPGRAGLVDGVELSPDTSVEDGV